MTNSKRHPVWMTLFVLNSLYWAGFWVYFFVRSIATPQHLAWEMVPPFYAVFGRSFPMAAPDVFRHIVFQSAFWSHLPCWLVTWPLGAAMGASLVLGTNAAGLRLIFVTALSYAQWYVVATFLAYVTRTWTLHPEPSTAKSR